MGSRSQRPPPIHPACIPGSIPPSSALSTLAFRPIRSGKPCILGRCMVCPSRLLNATAHPRRSPMDGWIAVRACMPRCTIHNPTDHGIVIAPSRAVLIPSRETPLNHETFSKRCHQPALCLANHRTASFLKPTSPAASNLQSLLHVELQHQARTDPHRNPHRKTPSHQGTVLPLRLHLRSDTTNRCVTARVFIQPFLATAQI